MSTQPTPTPANNDPFLDDDRFGQVDFTVRSEDMTDELSQIAAENPEFAPREEGDPDPAPAPAPASVPATAEETPSTMELPGGGTLTIEKGARGWKATLDTGIRGANAEVFYGRTKDELIMNVSAAKLNATKKIRELNRQQKLGIGSATPSAPAQPAAPAITSRELTADEKFEIKTQLAADPDLAMQSWFQKKTGMKLDQLVALANEGAQKGRRATAELDVEGIAKAFVADNPEYFSCNENLFAIVAYLSKEKLHRAFSEDKADELIGELYTNGHWTVDNLQAAYDELSESGLLETAPDDEPAQPAAAPAAAAPASPAPAAPAQPAPAATTPQNGRIVRETRRPRAGLGIRPTEASGTPPATEPNKPPSAEELDNLSDKEISDLFAGTRRAALQTRR